MREPASYIHEKNRILSIFPSLNFPLNSLELGASYDFSCGGRFSFSPPDEQHLFETFFDPTGILEFTAHFHQISQIPEFPFRSRTTYITRNFRNSGTSWYRFGSAMITRFRGIRLSIFSFFFLLSVSALFSMHDSHCLNPFSSTLLSSSSKKRAKAIKQHGASLEGGQWGHCALGRKDFKGRKYSKVR